MAPCKILIAEDDAIARTMISRLVESLGHVSILTSNGRRALDILTDNPDIALLVTDIAMPEMGGEELIQAVRESTHLAKLPIVIVSGVVGPNKIASLLDTGASRFLPKPIDSTMLKDYIQTLLKR